MSKNRILVIHRDPVARSGICGFLAAHGHKVAEASSREDAELQLQTFVPEAAVLDFSFPNGDATDLLQRIKDGQATIPVIALVSQGAPEVALRAIQGGAEQFLIKPFDLTLLHALLLRTLAGQRCRSLLSAPSRYGKRDHVDPFLGISSAIRKLRNLAIRVADSESPVLIQGETGSGKGVLANWIHRNGSRAEAAFLDLNCAGLSRELLESELFGHEKGAFTSAQNAKQGLLEVAHRGTVFLDEIGDIDLQVQPKLLKVLEDKVFRRLGDVHDRTVDIRLISATHRELMELVREQRFRSDLYFRMNIVPIRVPALRDRAEDIPLLAEHLLSRLSLSNGKECTIDRAAMGLLQQYSWPGNIRELRNVLERALLLAERNELRTEHLHFQSASLIVPPNNGSVAGTLKQVERSYIDSVLRDEGGCIESTARRLGIGRSSLYAKMKRYNIPAGTGRV